MDGENYLGPSRADGCHEGRSPRSEGAAQGFRLICLLPWPRQSRETPRCLSDLPTGNGEVYVKTRVLDPLAEARKLAIPVSTIFLTCFDTGIPLTCGNRDRIRFDNVKSDIIDTLHRYCCNRFPSGGLQAPKRGLRMPEDAHGAVSLIAGNSRSLGLRPMPPGRAVSGKAGGGDYPEFTSLAAQR